MLLAFPFLRVLFQWEQGQKWKGGEAKKQEADRRNPSEKKRQRRAGDVV